MCREDDLLTKWFGTCKSASCIHCLRRLCVFLFHREFKVVGELVILKMCLQLKAESCCQTIDYKGVVLVVNSVKAFRRAHFHGPAIRKLAWLFSQSHTCSWYLVRSFQSVLRSLAGILSEVFSEDMNREEKHIEWDLLACVACIVSRWRFPVFTCIMHQQQTRGGGGTHRTISSGLCVRE